MKNKIPLHIQYIYRKILKSEYTCEDLAITGSTMVCGCDDCKSHAFVFEYFIGEYSEK